MTTVSTKKGSRRQVPQVRRTPLRRPPRLNSRVAGFQMKKKKNTSRTKR